jgi:hypothetical protein
MNFAMLLLLFALDSVIFGPSGRFQLENSHDDFGMRSHGIIETLGSGQTKFYPLPQSTYAKYANYPPAHRRTNRCDLHSRNHRQMTTVR